MYPYWYGSMRRNKHSLWSRVVRWTKCAITRHLNSRAVNRHIYTLLTLIIIAFIALMFA